MTKEIYREGQKVYYRSAFGEHKITEGKILDVFYRLETSEGKDTFVKVDNCVVAKTDVPDFKKPRRKRRRASLLKKLKRVFGFAV